MSEKACEGGATIAVRTTEHMRKCRHCETLVREDLVDHPFFGFRSGCIGDQWDHYEENLEGKDLEDQFDELLGI